MNHKIPMSLPETDEADVQPVAGVIRSGRLALRACRRQTRPCGQVRPGGLATNFVLPFLPVTV